MPAQTTVLGFDISNNQPDVDFAPARKAGFRFVVHKVSEGINPPGPEPGWVDPAYLPQTASRKDRIKALQVRRDSAIDNGLLWTGYHWPRPQLRREPKAEADHFRTTMDDIGWTPGVDLPPWIDIEANYRNRYGVLTSAQLVDWVFDLVDECDELFDSRCTVYTGYVWRDGTWRNPAGGAVVPALGNPTRECKNPLALAAYVPNPDAYTPKSWSAHGRKKTFWQKTESGLIPGVGRGDIDVFMGDMAALHAHAKGRGR